jgi:hypothetical protein
MMCKIGGLQAKASKMVILPAKRKRPLRSFWDVLISSNNEEKLSKSNKINS